MRRLGLQREGQRVAQLVPSATARCEARSTRWCAGSRPILLPSSSIAASPRIRPWVRPRLARMRAVSTCRPATTSPIWRSAPAASVTICGSVSHSACQPPSARSCSCTMPASIVATSGGTRTAASAPPRSDRVALVRHGAGPTAAGAGRLGHFRHLGLHHQRDIARILPSVPVSMPSVVAISAMRSRCACHGSTGAARSSSRRRSARARCMTGCWSATTAG